MFVRDGRFSREARPLFLASGGYCNRHAWLLHEQLCRHGNGAPIADLYGMVLRHDRNVLRQFAARREGRRKRRPLAPLQRRRCLACVNSDAADRRHAYFFMRALDEERVRRLYGRADGLCLAHAMAVVDEALEDDQSEIASFLVEETLRRLDSVATLLEEYDRRRDYRYADLPKGREQHAWTDVIRLYVGDQSLSRLPPARGEPPAAS